MSAQRQQRFERQQASGANRRAMLSSSVVSLVALLLCGQLLHPAQAELHHSKQAARPAYNQGAYNWRTGRASFYGNDGGATIHQGSCMFGYLDPNKGTGWDIAAISDGDADYQGSCGRCYEVQCVPMKFKDGYGNALDRTGACKGGASSVVVRITDTCPCWYPNNAYSNKRWCCQDMPHLDLSEQAFMKIADVSQGVAGIRYRPVDCPR